MASIKAKLERRELSCLVPFPMQSKLFDDLSSYDIEALARDIKENGLRQPIEIIAQNNAGLSPNTILCGHQRRQAMLLLNRTKCEVLVRYDLADAPFEAIEKVFIDDNLNRRQLDPLAKARAALRLIEIERGTSVDRMSNQARGEARDRVGKAIGMSGRNLDRYFALLKAPTAIQNAFRSRQLRLVDAAKIARMRRRTQAEIVAAIESGEEPRNALARHASNPPRQKAAAHSLKVFVNALSVAQAELKDSQQEIPLPMITESLSSLKGGRRLIRDLIRLVETA